MTNRLFAYNPSGNPIDGCEIYGTLAVSVTEQPYCNDIGGIKWWGGADEDLGYIVAKVIPPNDQPTEVPGLTGDVAFNRSTVKTEASFLDMVRIAFGQTFGSGNNAKTWLNNNNCWTNWGLGSPSPTPTSTQSAPTPTPTSTSVSSPTPTPTPTRVSAFYYANTQGGANEFATPLTGVNRTDNNFCSTSTISANQFASLTGTYYVYESVTMSIRQISTNNTTTATFTSPCI
jgi:hypothetical protein